MIKYLSQYWVKSQVGGRGYKWKTLQHNGVMFPPEYVPHEIPIIYNGESIILPPLAEEYATLYAKYIDTEYIKNPDFNKNFWSDWKKILGKNSPIKSLEGCDFSKIYKHILKEKEKKLQIDTEEKDNNKKERELSENKYKIAIVDGKNQGVGNYKVEPPGIFLGRGSHPLLGSIKRRIYPEDITINIGKGVELPVPKIQGDTKQHHWGEIIHDRTVEWLASWKDDITGKIKYVWLNQHSDLRKRSDFEKFELARKLKRKIKTIREKYEQDLQNEDIKIRQLATALYLIDRLALRVGNEKGEDEADTVGVTSLRVEHVKLNNNVVYLDFLGKDSIRYKNKFIPIVEIYNNLESFMIKKGKYDNIFDYISTSDINKYLQTFMKGLTAKVFRTFNASELLYKELRKLGKKYENYDKDDLINILLDGFNKANAKVAILCNHQKNVSKGFGKQLDNINEQMKNLKKKIDESDNSSVKSRLKEKLRKLKVKKALKIELKDVALGTSKINYLDVRISVAFCKRFNIPLEKIFPKNLQEKFAWGLDVDKDWKF
jgi:DNA topoisomerase-1